MFNQQRSDQAPFRQAGLVGLQQYMAMLGLGGSGAQAYGGGQTGGSYSGPSSPPPALFQMVNGVPSVNQSLYASDPAYKKAWDEATAEHQAGFGQGYNKYSSVDAVSSRLNQLYKPSGSVGTAGYEKGTPINLGGSTAAAKTPAQTQQDAFAMFRNTPGYQFGLDEGNKSV